MGSLRIHLLTLSVIGILLPGCRTHQSAPPQAQNQPEGFDASGRNFHGKIRSIVYPYSVIAGGVSSAEDVAEAAEQDGVVREHYQDVDIQHLEKVTVKRPTAAYVSFRKKGEIFWTRHKVQIPKGDRLLTDGTNTIRARCGNRVSWKPQEPVLPAARAHEEPTSGVLNTPEVRGQVMDEMPLPQILTPNWAPGAAAAPMPESGWAVAPTPAAVPAVVATGGESAGATPAMGGGGGAGGGGGLAATPSFPSNFTPTFGPVIISPAPVVAGSAPAASAPTVVYVPTFPGTSTPITNTPAPIVNPLVNPPAPTVNPYSPTPGVVITPVTPPSAPIIPVTPGPGPNPPTPLGPDGPHPTPPGHITPPGQPPNCPPNLAEVPEPAAFGLVALGLAGFVALRRRHT